MTLEGLSSVCAKLEPAGSKNNEILEINVPQKFTEYTLYYTNLDQQCILTAFVWAKFSFYIMILLFRIYISMIIYKASVTILQNILNLHHTFSLHSQTDHSILSNYDCNCVDTMGACVKLQNAKNY